MKVILVTGTPGTGKTTYAKKLCEKKGYIYLDVNTVIEKHNLSEGFDKERKAKIIDTEKLNKIIVQIINTEKNKKTKALVIDSHLSHYLNKKHADICIVTKCNLKELKRRLKKRNYPKAKIRENLDVEIFDTCRIEALEAGHNVKILYTDKR